MARRIYSLLAMAAMIGIALPLAVPLVAAPS